MNRQFGHQNKFSVYGQKAVPLYLKSSIEFEDLNLIRSGCKKSAIKKDAILLRGDDLKGSFVSRGRQLKTIRLGYLLGDPRRKKCDGKQQDKTAT
jgi:hypothetical protein